MPDMKHTIAPSTLTRTQIEDTLVASLSPLARLALAYAPSRHRLSTLALLALDARLANLLRHSKEPMLAQLRMTWWRETLGQDVHNWPSGEPLLAALRSWEGEHARIIPLIDGWEALTAPAPIAEQGLLAMAKGRGEAFAAFAQAAGHAEYAPDALAIGTAWGLTDLAAHLRNPEEKRAVVSLIASSPAASSRRPLPRALRPLKVMETLSARRFAKDSDDAGLSPMALMAALRVGLIGR